MLYDCGCMHVHTYRQHARFTLAMTARCLGKWEGAWPKLTFCWQCWSYQNPDEQGHVRVPYPFCHRDSLREAQEQPRHILELGPMRRSA